MRLIVFILIFSFVLDKTFAQKDSSWNVLLLQKQEHFKQKEEMHLFSKSGFYFYRNCIYEFELKDKKVILGRLIDIKADSIYLTNYLNQNEAMLYDDKLDTVGLHYKELKKLLLERDLAISLYNQKIPLDNYIFQFQKDTLCRTLKSNWYPIYKNDTTAYELVPRLTAKGLDLLYESDGIVRPFEDVMIKPSKQEIDSMYRVRNVIGFIPTQVNEINGLALGLFAKNVRNSNLGISDTLVIRGLCVELNPFEFIQLLNPYFEGPYSNNLEMYKKQIQKDIQVRIKGINVSLVNNINEMDMRGLSLVGGITTIDEIHGVSISGISNFAYILKGISIAGLRNKATSAKGIQIGLINNATDLRGIQIGLWNVNAKRKLPFINWQFSKKNKKS